MATAAKQPSQDWLKLLGAHALLVVGALSIVLPTLFSLARGPWATEAGVQGDLSYITAQVGMFSYSGLSKDQMQRLRSEFGIYGVDSGRICVAALNDGNLAYVAKAIAAVSA